MTADADQLASDLAALGYPGFAYLRGPAREADPAELVLRALASDDLEARIVEAVVWLVWQYPELNWGRLIPAAEALGLQNRLGFVTTLARQAAELKGEAEKAALLVWKEEEIALRRLDVEDTLCQASITDAERRWVRAHRTKEAERWGLLSDLSVGQLTRLID